MANRLGGASRQTSQPPASRRLASGTRSRAWRSLDFEPLEARWLLSASIPLSTTAWTALGPAPIVSGIGVVPGNPNTGRVESLATDPTNSNIIYVATAGGGVWKTSNAGSSWTPLTDNQVTTTMGAIALAPSNPNVIYAGTGDPDGYYGQGILKSIDAGASWTLLGTSQFYRRTIAKIVVDATDPNTAYVAVNTGGIQTLSGNAGIWKTSDGGTTWTNTTSSITSLGFRDLVVDPSNHLTLYAASFAFGSGSSNTLYKSTNAGASWSVAGNFPVGDASNGRMAVAIAPSSTQTIYVSIANESTGGIYKIVKSADGGATWNQVTTPTNYLGNQGGYDTTLAVDPSNANVVFAGGTSDSGGPAFIESTDGGVSWSSISVGANGNSPHTDHHAIGFDASGRLLDGNDGGIWRLDNSNVGSIAWTDLNGNIGTVEFYGIALDPTNPNIAYGGSQDNGTERFNDSLGWTGIASGDGGITLVDPTTPTTVYLQANQTIYRSDNSGPTKTSKMNGIDTSGGWLVGLNLVEDAANSSRLLCGTNQVYETTDRGDDWTAISTPNANGWNTNSGINAVAPAPSDVNTIYASTSGHVWVTTNHGATWAQRDVPGGVSLTHIKVDPNNAQIAFGVAYGFGVAKVWETVNAGVTWTAIGGNLPDLPMNTIELGTVGGTQEIFVGNDSGVYASVNQGATWSQIGTGLPNVRVHDLEYNASLNILAAGTYGRGLWELIIDPATHLVVTTQPPGTVTAGSGFGFTVAAEDSQGNVASGYLGNVTVALASNPGSSTLGGNVTVSVASGLAVFTGLNLNNAANAYTLQATSGNLTSVTTTPFNVLGILPISGTASVNNVQITFTDATDFNVVLNGAAAIAYSTPADGAIVYNGANGTLSTLAFTDVFNTYAATLTSSTLQVAAAGYSVNTTNCTTTTVTGTAADTATLSGTTGANQFYGKPAISELLNTGAGTTYTETVDNFGTVNATSSSSSDVAYLYDKTGTNTFSASPTTANMNGTGYAYNATAFPVVYAIGSAVNNDRAYLSDAAGGLFVAYPTSAVSYGSGYYNYASNFKVVYDTMASANNQSFLYDTSGANVFERHNAAGGTPAYSVFYNPAGSFYNLVINSLQVTATAAAGTTDQAYLTDNTANSQLYGKPTSTLLSTGGTTNFLASNFGNVQTTETGTSNTENAYMYDSTGTDRFYGTPPGFQGIAAAQSVVAGAGYSSVAIGFGQSYGISAGGGKDTAYLFDAAGNGTFYGGNTQDTLQGTGYYYTAVGFRYVFGLGAGGGDTAYFTDTVGGNFFEGHQPYSVLYNQTNLYVYASGFTTVGATGNGNKGTDTAFLYDSPGNDEVIAAGNTAQLVYSAGNVANVGAFANVAASSTLGGTDKKFLSAVDYNLSVTGNWQ
jgi:hypothetical protein